MVSENYTEGGLYAVEREDGWHLASWDGKCFEVTSGWQSGDRWLPEWLTQVILVAAHPRPPNDATKLRNQISRARRDPQYMAARQRRG